MNGPRLSPDYERDRRVWDAVSSRWLDRVFPAIAEAAQRVAHGDRGVVELTADTADMEQMLAAPSVRATVELSWHPADNFIDTLCDPRAVGSQIGCRWGALLAAMDPARDVALFLHSTADADGKWFFRFLVVHAAKLPSH